MTIFDIRKSGTPLQGHGLYSLYAILSMETVMSAISPFVSRAYSLTNSCVNNRFIALVCSRWGGEKSIKISSGRKS